MSLHDPIDVRSQEAAQQDARERTQLENRIEAEDIKWLMSSKRGRRIAYRLLERAGVWRLSFDTNALRMAFNEGNRNEGLALFAKVMEHCPEQFPVMLKEQEKNG